MAANQTQTTTIACAGANISNSAYSAVFTSTPIPCTKMVICNSAAVPVKIAIGGAGSEMDLVCVGVNMVVVVDIGLNICPLGSRVSAEAVSAAATTGFVSVSLIP